MAQDDLEDLLRRGPDRPLDGLEADVWRGVATREAGDRRLRAKASAQACLALVALLAGLAAGGISARHGQREVAELGVFSPHAALAPSSRLIGSGL